jgi:hypothetical protein
MIEISTVIFRVAMSVIVIMVVVMMLCHKFNFFVKVSLFEIRGDLSEIFIFVSLKRTSSGFKIKRICIQTKFRYGAVI